MKSFIPPQTLTLRRITATGILILLWPWCLPHLHIHSHLPRVDWRLNVRVDFSVTQSPHSLAISLLTMLALTTLIISCLLGLSTAYSVELENEFSTIDRSDLIAHELVNPFTPYFRDSKYRGKRGKVRISFLNALLCLVCKGFSTWQDAIFNNFEKLKANFDRNCTHILGSLVISGILPGMPSFLNKITFIRILLIHFILLQIKILTFSTVLRRFPDTCSYTE